MNNAWPETVLLWGAGATKSAGLLTTNDIACALTHILEQPFPNFDKLNFSRLFPGISVDTQLQKGFKELLSLLCWADSLSISYDLEALKHISRISPKFFDASTGRKTNLGLQELFSLIDQLLDNNLGIEVIDDNGEKLFLEVRRINAARNCLKLLTEELQRVAIQGDTPGRMSNAAFYYDFAETLSELMTQEAAIYEQRGYKKDSRDFYLYSYAIISFNWDPLIMWALFNAHKARNDKPPYMDKCLPLRLFKDLGTTIATRKVDSDSNVIWYSASETQVIKINDYEYPSRIMRVGKLLYPHGIFGSRLCPQCGKLIMSFGNVWDKASPLAFGPSLIQDLQQNWKYNNDEENEPGVIKCPFCGQKTYPQDMPLEMQTVIKKRPIAPLEEIKKEMGLLIKHAKHIVFAGYSLPMDDISEKVFIASSLSGKKIEEKKCTIIEFDPGWMPGQGWLEGKDILSYLQERKGSGVCNTVNSILSIFDISQTRLTLKGIPGIFDSYSNMEQAVIDVLYRGEFPPVRNEMKG
ncbi:MAG: hypothetical protein JL50_00880 [Peptococcaceae bacterium BICA1-7]|nr:MAG: hypothetical protein JL50_00880 [Peptococcaceae bacterium BICA1-7]HBV98056.1 hypothetical protein [Desulfotomaculum sp.]